MLRRSREGQSSGSATTHTPFGVHGIKVPHKKRTHTSPVAQRLLCLVLLSMKIMAIIGPDTLKIQHHLHAYPGSLSVIRAVEDGLALKLLQVFFCHSGFSILQIISHATCNHFLGGVQACKFKSNFELHSIQPSL